MKKNYIIISISVILLIAIVLGILVYNAVTVPENKKYVVETVKAKSEDVVKVGIISDIQLPQEEKHLYGWDYSTVMNGAEHLIKALKYFKSQDVDLLIFNGDIVNSTGDYASYSAYNKVLDYVYGEERTNAPHIIYPMGNHEFYGANQEHEFYKATGLPLNTRTVINGYSFISISNSKLQNGDEKLAESNGTLADGTYNQDRISFLKEQLSVASKDAPEKPIFVFLHMPISDIVNGGQWATPQYEEIYDILKEYPQAVVFTSHSHYCMSDERSIMQKDFTIVNTGTASYFDFDWFSNEDENTENDIPSHISQEAFAFGKDDSLRNKDYMVNPQLLGIEESGDVPYRSNVNNGYLMRIDTTKNSFSLKKINLNTGLEFGEEFTMDSFDKSTFTRTKKILETGASPTFGTDKAIAEVKPECVEVTFACAQQNMPIKYYIYELTKENGEKTYVRFFGKNYILGDDVAYTEHNRLVGLEKGKYSMKIYAVNSFNKISTDFLISEFEIL